MKTILYGVVLVAVMVGAAPGVQSSEEGHGGHDAHVHGKALLNIAMEGDAVVVELITPAANIVGFEHAPGTEAEREAVRSAAAELGDAAGWLVPPAEAGCRVESAHVESALLEQDAGHEHADFHVHQSLRCDAPGALDRLSVTLFEAFPGLESIEAQVLTPTRQLGAELTPGDAVIELE